VARLEFTAPAWLLAVVLACLWSCCRAGSDDGEADALRLVVLEGHETAVASRRMLHTEANLASTRDAGAAAVRDTQYVLAVPASAVDWSHTPPVVTAIRNGQIVQVEVQVSIVDAVQGLAGIRAGLQPNERVVLGTDRNLTPGTPVRVQPAPSDETSPSPLGRSAAERCVERQHARLSKTRCATSRAHGALQRERRHRITAKLPPACHIPPHPRGHLSTPMTFRPSEATWTSSECSGRSITRSLARRSAWSATSASRARSG
jgi:hypothetical protein